jgi:hypothetical protein
MNIDTKRAGVMKKAMEILRKNLKREEYVTYLELGTKQAGGSVAELREKTENLTIDEIMDQIS